MNLDKTHVNMEKNVYKKPEQYWKGKWLHVLW